MIRLLFLFLATSLTACDAGKNAPAEDDHHHAEPQHGGMVIEVGAEAAHLELVHDNATGTATLYVTGPDAKTPLAIAAPELKVTSASGPLVITTEAVNAKDGKASTFKATHDALKKDPIDGRVSLTIDGKAYNPLIEDAHADHDH